MFKILGVKFNKKPQTSILRSRVALAIIEDADMQARMIEDGTFKKYFRKVKKYSKSKFLKSNCNRIRNTEGENKLLVHIDNHLLFTMAQIQKLTSDTIISIDSSLRGISAIIVAKRFTKQVGFETLQTLARKTSDQHAKNYETLQDNYKITDRILLKMFVNTLV